MTQRAKDLLLNGRLLPIVVLIIILCVVVSLLIRWIVGFFVTSADQQRWIAAVIAYLGAMIVFVPRIVAMVIDYRINALNAVPSDNEIFKEHKDRAKSDADHSKLAIQIANPVGFALVTLSFLLST